MAEHQFEHDHAGLDGLAETHVVSNQQVDTGHLDGADDGVKLVAFDFDAATEGRLELAGVGDGCSAPAYGVEEGFEAGWLVEAFGLRQFHLFEGTGAGLDFPDDLQFLAEGVVFDGGQADKVLWALRKLRSGSARRTSVTT